MNCQDHPEVPATGYCRVCGRPLCGDCRREAEGTVFCSAHVPAPAASGTPPVVAKSSAPVSGASPGLAFALGLIPGVGAIYNGQYVKGIVHVIILGLLISIVNSSGVGEFGPLFGFLIAAWYFYMPFEAYHTARKHQLGLAVDEFSSLVPLRRAHPGSPVGPVLLIGLGVLFLLNTLGLLRLREIVRFWPVLLIVLGGWMLYNRLTGHEPYDALPPADQEVSHEER